MSAFSCKFEINGDSLTLTFSGSINESSRLDQLKVGSEYKSITFEMDAVELINSVGVREWITWHKEIATEARQISFRGIPVVMVHQINILNGFMPKNSAIESFYVPFYCEECDISAQLLYKVGVDLVPTDAMFAPDIGVEPFAPKTPVSCPKCKKCIDLDMTNGKYFRFLRDSKRN